jgi:thiol:disulfide interchange protein DsbD
LVEIAAAFKFLNIADNAWHWGLFSRNVVFSIWAAIMAIIAIYVIGRWRTDSDSPVEHVGAGRLILCLIFATMAIWLMGGVAGNDLGRLESFLAQE